MPKSNVEFWQAKLLRNHNRDIAQRAELEAAGWRVITVWECELRKPCATNASYGCMSRLLKEMQIQRNNFSSPLEGS